MCFIIHKSLYSRVTLDLWFTNDHDTLRSTIILYLFCLNKRFFTHHIILTTETTCSYLFRNPFWIKTTKNVENKF